MRKCKNCGDEYSRPDRDYCPVCFFTERIRRENRERKFGWIGDLLEIIGLVVIPSMFLCYIVVIFLVVYLEKIGF